MRKIDHSFIKFTTVLSGNTTDPYEIGDYNFVFSTCNTRGSFGPKQEACDNAYQYRWKLNHVAVKNGVQIWVVPKSGEWSISVSGAHGGGGAMNQDNKPPGAFVHARLELL